MQIKIDDATPTQLANFAASKGLDGINFRMGAFEIRRRLIDAGYTLDHITVVDGTGPVQADPDVSKPVPELDQIIEVFVEQQESPGGSEPVFVSHNFVSMRIPRGVWAPIKKKFLPCLADAIRIVIDPVPMDPSKPMDIGGTMPPREIPQYPFRTRVPE